MKKKGFTLVELLGVIVVLAIIALIVVPTVIGVIDKTRKNSLRNSGYGLVEAGTLYYVEKQNTKTVRFDIKDNEVITEEKINYKGFVKEGTVLINKKGKVVICINDGKYAAYKNFEDNKVTLVEGKTCTVPENSSIVYLDNEATVDTNIEELVAEINALKEKVESLETEKAEEIDVINLMNNLTTTHNSDMSNISTRLEALTQALNNKNNFHEINQSFGFVSSTELVYTNATVTIPANSYYCLTAKTYWHNSPPRVIAISTSSNNEIENVANIIAMNGSQSLNLSVLSATVCSVTTNDTPLYIFEKRDGTGYNMITLTGFYVSK